VDCFENSKKSEFQQAVLQELWKVTITCIDAPFQCFVTLICHYAVLLCCAVSQQITDVASTDILLFVCSQRIAIFLCVRWTHSLLRLVYFNLVIFEIIQWYLWTTVYVENNHCTQFKVNFVRWLRCCLWHQGLTFFN